MTGFSYRCLSCAVVLVGLELAALAEPPLPASMRAQLLFAAEVPSVSEIKRLSAESSLLASILDEKSSKLINDVYDYYRNTRLGGFPPFAWSQSLSGRAGICIVKNDRGGADSLLYGECPNPEISQGIVQHFLATWRHVRHRESDEDGATIYEVVLREAEEGRRGEFWYFVQNGSHVLLASSRQLALKSNATLGRRSRSAAFQADAESLLEHGLNASPQLEVSVRPAQLGRFLAGDDVADRVMLELVEVAGLDRLTRANIKVSFSERGRAYAEVTCRLESSDGIDVLPLLEVAEDTPSWVPSNSTFCCRLNVNIGDLVKQLESRVTKKFGETAWNSLVADPVGSRLGVDFQAELIPMLSGNVVVCSVPSEGLIVGAHFSRIPAALRKAVERQSQLDVPTSTASRRVKSKSWPIRIVRDWVVIGSDPTTERSTTQGRRISLREAPPDIQAALAELTGEQVHGRVNFNLHSLRGEDAGSRGEQSRSLRGLGAIRKRGSEYLLSVIGFQE